MTMTQAIVLGLVQGVTEFLPISSSGFLILVPELFDWDIQNLAFDAFLHIATLIAIIAALWTEVKAISMALLVPSRSKESNAWRRLAIGVFLATLPVVIVGFFLQEVLKVEFRSVEIVAWSFIVWGLVLFFVDRRTVEKYDSTKNIRLRQALFIGLAQVLALIPGTSRSGITITAGLASGLSRVTASKFSFLLAIPTIAAAGFLKLGQVSRGETNIDLFPLAVGFLVAMASAFLTVRFLLKFLERYTFAEFAVFRVLVGIAILLIW